jgi:hypothetical protein
MKRLMLLALIALISCKKTQELNEEIKYNYKDYKKTSNELFNSTGWFSSDSLFFAGSKYTYDNPLLVIQTVQLDINGDGLEDIFTYDSYPLNVSPTPNPPPSVFINNGKIFEKIKWSGPTVRNPHGTKLLVGDFNNDSLPDIFSLVAVDMPFNAPPSFKDYNNILFNSKNGFSKIKEFDDQFGFWYTGCSGDIDNDKDLDVIMFNFHYLGNGIQSKILWNDGRGNFSYDSTGIGKIPIVDHAELNDINKDGYLDLVIDYVTFPVRTPNVAILFGNGKEFSLQNSVQLSLRSNQFLNSLNFADLNKDGFNEIIVGSYDGKNTLFEISILQSLDKGKTIVNKTTEYISNFQITDRFDLLRLQDIDNDGNLDLFAPDKKSNIRWEWNGSRFLFR